MFPQLLSSTNGIPIVTNGNQWPALDGAGAAGLRAGNGGDGGADDAPPAVQSRGFLQLALSLRSPANQHLCFPPASPIPRK